MDAIWIVLILLTVFVAIGVVIAGGVTLFLRVRAREPINVNLRSLLRIYMLVVIVAGLLVFTRGAADLMQAGFATIGSNQFSYDPVYVRLPADDEPRPVSPLEIKDWQQLTDDELQQLSVLQTEHRQQQIELDEERSELGLDRALKEGLIQGISFLIIGILILASHLFGRRWLETGEEKEGLLNRVYLIVVTITFGIITIVYLPQAVFETISYVVLDPIDSFNRNTPGRNLALSFATLPIWLTYLWAIVRAMRRAPA